MFPPPAKAERKIKLGTGSGQTEEVLWTRVSKDVEQIGACLNLAVSKAAVTLGNKQIKTQTLQVQACAVRLPD